MEDLRVEAPKIRPRAFVLRGVWRSGMAGIAPACSGQWDHEVVVTVPYGTAARPCRANKSKQNLLAQSRDEYVMQCDKDVKNVCNVIGAPLQLAWRY